MARKKLRKWIVRIVLIVVAIPLLGLAGLIIHGTVNDYNPEERIELNVAVSDIQQDTMRDTLTFLTWNIGYGGLGTEMDFFYDGGKQVRPERTLSSIYFEQIEAFTQGQESVDFLLYQEVDRNSKRSYARDQYKELKEISAKPVSSFALNYNVKHVPMPFSDPLGKVESGLATFSNVKPASAVRYQFPGNYGWPKKVFMLDRCFMVSRFPLNNGKELLVINTHNSAYDDGSLKEKQMEYLRGFLLKEYEKGNFLVIGGDWNQCPPNFDQNKFIPPGGAGYPQMGISPDFMPADWLWAYDATTPTNRSLKTPYDAHTSMCTVIDFFLLSPNVRLLGVRGMDLGFVYSDHQPVWMKIALINE